MKVENLTNARGNKVANQFIITDGDKVSFQSYNSLIATYGKGKNLITFGCDWNYSNTTMKHLSIFLADFCDMNSVHSKEIRKAIQDGEYIFPNPKYKIKVAYDENMR